MDQPDLDQEDGDLGDAPSFFRCAARNSRTKIAAKLRELSESSAALLRPFFREIG